jgi:3-hydroxyisobutyrate dehydrogenase-like beta-hydroxyacid dehydrogenase
MASDTLSVGWIGLGNAGYPMAACLGKKGYRLVVRDADPERGVKFVEEYPKSRVATMTADTFADCDVVVTMLPNGKVVREVVLGENGIAKHMKAGMYLGYTPKDSRVLR